MYIQFCYILQLIFSREIKIFSWSFNIKHGHLQAKNTGVVFYFLLQGIFLNQGSNLSLLQFRQILYCQGGTRETTREYIGTSNQVRKFKQSPVISLELLETNIKRDLKIAYIISSAM